MTQQQQLKANERSEVESVAVKHMMEWVDYLKRKSDYGQHLQIPSEMSAGACWDLARELEQFIKASPPPVAEPHKRQSRSDVQPLTPESVFQIADQHPVEGFDPDIMAFARAIEAAHNIFGDEK